jgi:hypothetical protein
MNLHPHRYSFATLGRLRVSTYGSAAIVLFCAAVGVTMGLLFPLRTHNLIASSIEERHPFNTAPRGTIEPSATAVVPIVEPPKMMSERESTTSVVPVSRVSTKPQRAVGKSPIETDNPCRWSQSADGTLTCAGRQVMIPGAGDALHVRQCSMVFHDKVRFSGIDMHVVSKQTKGNPFLVRSPDDWKMHLDAANSTTVTVIFTADNPEPGNVICQYSYHLQKVP